MKRMTNSRRGAIRVLTAALMLAAAAAAAPIAGAITYSSGDLIYVAYGSGGGPELIVDIGPASTYLTATSTFNVPQVKAGDFSSVIGLSRANTYIGIFGVKNVATRDGILTTNGPKDSAAFFYTNVLGGVAQTDPFGNGLAVYGTTVIGSPEAVSFSSNTTGSYENVMNFVSKGSIAGNMGYNIETRFSDATGTHISTPVKIHFDRAEKNPYTGLSSFGCVGFFTLNTNGTVSYSPDIDCDFIADEADLCVGVNSTNNTDTDGDHHGAPCDCNDNNPAVWAVPGEVQNLNFAGSTTLLSWVAPANLGGTQTPVYDVFRGTQAAVATPVYACYSPDQAALSKNDVSKPAVGDAYFYLVRAQNSCGNGTVGSGFGVGVPSPVVPSCP